MVLCSVKWMIGVDGWTIFFLPELRYVLKRVGGCCKMADTEGAAAQIWYSLKINKSIQTIRYAFYVAVSFSTA